uniref:Candidate secreted effector n=1 Tax=Meloidogyne incognita TaxID=6306 RepID=A0A914MKB4_MELIC
MAAFPSIFLLQFGRRMMCFMCVLTNFPPFSLKCLLDYHPAKKQRKKNSRLVNLEHSDSL